MLLLPLFERLTSYLLGFAAWCFLLGADNPVGVDLVPAGTFALLACLGCMPVLLGLQRSSARVRGR
jgi:hypothetical protein